MIIIDKNDWCKKEEHEIDNRLIISYNDVSTKRFIFRGNGVPERGIDDSMLLFKINGSNIDNGYGNAFGSESTNGIGYGYF
jgi:hypothetical protein